MHSPASLTLLPLLLLLPLTQALPTTTTPLNPVSDLDLSKRQTATTCGNTLYPQQSLQAALNAGCSYTNQGGQAGGSSYPHVYNNYEGFDFAAGGTYYEFPIVMGGAYDGGSPGADRVIYNRNCQYAGAITHSGASGNAFVGCSGTS